jgi:hypothetical protein
MTAITTFAIHVKSDSAPVKDLFRLVKLGEVEIQPGVVSYVLFASSRLPYLTLEMLTSLPFNTYKYAPVWGLGSVDDSGSLLMWVWVVIDS